ncbi:MAG TPA: shikimate dehydrogenase [Chthoniobacterales bacterium]|nr:shikimate dehydrogenase [Chthoniobacterales bacterium]
MPVLTLDTLRELSGPDLRLAVIGDPVDHSLSPPMHNAGLKFLHLPFRYGRLRVRPEELEAAFEILRNKNFIGWNLTLPHKLAAVDLLDQLDPLAERLKAVNTVVNRSHRLSGFNTDGTGLVAAISESFQCNISGVRIALLGAGGGAGQAAARYLASLNVPDLILLNRTAAKAEALAGELSHRSHSNVRAKPWERLPEICNEVDLIINASTTGPALESLTGIEPRHMVFDMVYGPQETPLVTFARAKGARSADGLLMLLFQGIFAFEIWFGKPAPAAEMRDALFKAAGRG